MYLKAEHCNCLREDKLVGSGMDPFSAIIETTHTHPLEKIMPRLHHKCACLTFFIQMVANNPENINAIKTETFVQGAWAIIGNVQKQKIPKLTVALRQQTIRQDKFSKTPKYKINILNSGCSGLMCITIRNGTKWGLAKMI